jgi:hypothetical protein
LFWVALHCTADWLYLHYPGAVEIPQKLSPHEILNLHSSSTPCPPEISEIQVKYDQQWQIGTLFRARGLAVSELHPKDTMTNRVKGWIHENPAWGKHPIAPARFPGLLLVLVL